MFCSPKRQKMFTPELISVVEKNSDQKSSISPHVNKLFEQITGKIALVTAVGTEKGEVFSVLNRLLGVPEAFNSESHVIEEDLVLWGQPVKIADDFHAFFAYSKFDSKMLPLLASSLILVVGPDSVDLRGLGIQETLLPEFFQIHSNQQPPASPGSNGPAVEEEEDANDSLIHSVYNEIKPKEFNQTKFNGSALIDLVNTFLETVGSSSSSTTAVDSSNYEKFLRNAAFFEGNSELKIAVTKYRAYMTEYALSKSKPCSEKELRDFHKEAIKSVIDGAAGFTSKPQSWLEEKLKTFFVQAQQENAKKSNTFCSTLANDLITSNSIYSSEVCMEIVTTFLKDCKGPASKSVFEQVLLPKIFTTFEGNLTSIGKRGKKRESVKKSQEISSATAAAAAIAAAAAAPPALATLAEKENQAPPTLPTKQEIKPALPVVTAEILNVFSDKERRSWADRVCLLEAQCEELRNLIEFKETGNSMDYDNDGSFEVKGKVSDQMEWFLSELDKVKQENNKIIDQLKSNYDEDLKNVLRKLSQVNSQSKHNASRTQNLGFSMENLRLN
jgi:hypothetical protein